MKNKTASLTFTILATSFAAVAQTELASADTTTFSSDTRVNLQREIRMERNSKPEEVVLHIDEQVNSFQLVVNSSVSAGDLTIEVYDANGKKHGTFSMGTQLQGKKQEQVKGNINKRIEDPQAGNWRVSIVPIEATGIVAIQTSLTY